MLCDTSFTAINRRHHCRACGKVLCQTCSHFVDPELVFEDASPNNARSSNNTTSNTVSLARISPSASTTLRSLAPQAVRVCGPCAISTSKVAVAKEVPVAISKMEEAIEKTPACVYLLYSDPESLVIGSLSVLCVQARGLPAADANGLSDPYVKLTLTGYTLSGGQEWPEAMRTMQKTSTRYSTLNPIWSGTEIFHFRVPRAHAVLRVEVKDWDLGVSNDALGSVEIPLATLLHQRRVDQWFELVSADDGEPAGEIRLLLKYSFNRSGEVCSRFWPEPPYVPDVPGFSPNRVYKHITDLMEEVKPYVALLGAVGSILSWQWPVLTLLAYGVVLALTLYPRYIYSSIQMSLVLYVLYSYVHCRGKQHSRDLEDAKKKNLSLREFLKQRQKDGKGLVGRLTSLGHRRRASSDTTTADEVVSAGAAAGEGGPSKEELAAKAEDEKKRQEEEQQGIASLGLVINFLGKRIGRSEATTNLQNALGMLAKLLKSIRQLLEWEWPAATAILVLLLTGSAVAHLFISVTWLFVLVEALVFQLLTWPLQVGVWWGTRLVHSARSLATQLKFAMQRTVPGEVVVVVRQEEGEGETGDGGKSKPG